MGGGAARDVLLAVLPFPEPTLLVQHLTQKFPALDVHYVQTSFSHDGGQQLADPVPRHLWRSATILVTLSTVPDPHDAPKLEWIHLVSAGSNQLQGTPVYHDTDVTITTSSGIHGPQIAEWVIMTGLVQSHGYKQLYELQRKRQWGDKSAGPEDRYHNVRDWVGRRMGILGYGSIGRQVGRVAKAMGVDVVAFTATPKDTAEKRRDRGFIVPGTGDELGEVPVEWHSGLDRENLHHFLARDLDWLVVAVPLTDQTRHFLGRDEFRVLSRHGQKPAFITNIARGPIVDQPALVAALQDGTLAGAALDVTDPEPLPEDSELWGMENVIVTPHVSGVGVAYMERTFQVLERNLERREHGEKLINVVRRSRGY